jgi:hypothetical protein
LTVNAEREDAGNMTGKPMSEDDKAALKSAAKAKNARKAA